MKLVSHTEFDFVSQCTFLPNLLFWESRGRGTRFFGRLVWAASCRTVRCPEHEERPCTIPVVDDARHCASMCHDVNNSSTKQDLLAWQGLTPEDGAAIAHHGVQNLLALTFRPLDATAAGDALRKLGWAPGDRSPLRRGCQVQMRRCSRSWKRSTWTRRKRGRCSSHNSTRGR